MIRSILIIDDEPNLRWVLGQGFARAGYLVAGAASGDEALVLLAQQPCDLVLLDLRLRGEDGLTVLRRLRERWPELVVILLTAYGTVASAVEAMQLGAADVLRKPFDVDEVLFKVQRALERRALQQTIAQLERQRRIDPWPALIGESAVWQRVIARAQAAAEDNAPLWIAGEPGSGRTRLAHAIHAASARAAAPLVTLDLEQHPAAAHAALLDHRLPGSSWEQAGSGTLLVHGAADSAGWETPAHGARLVVVTTAAAPSSWPGRTLVVPALRERRADLVALAWSFANGNSISPAAIRLLEAYHWPENVAELRAIIARARVLAGAAPIGPEHLGEWITAAPPPTELLELPAAGISLEALERSLIRQALERAHGNKTRAAELLGLSRHTLLYRIEKYQIGDGTS